MSKKTLKTKTRKLFHGDKILWAGLIFFSIPVLILLFILFQSSLSTGKVIEGNRFKNDLDPSITSSLIETTQTQIEGVNDVENSSITLKAATLMVSVQVSSTNVNEDFVKIAANVVNVLNQNIPLATYFTSTDTKKMYDLQIDIYNTVSSSDDSIQFHTILVKNANMLEYSVQDVSTALNPTLAEELRAAVEAKNNPTDTTLPTGGSETEAPSTTQ